MFPGINLRPGSLRKEKPGKGLLDEEGQGLAFCIPKSLPLSCRRTKDEGQHSPHKSFLPHSNSLTSPLPVATVIPTRPKSLTYAYVLLLRNQHPAMMPGPRGIHTPAMRHQDRNLPSTLCPYVTPVTPLMIIFYLQSSVVGSYGNFTDHPPKDLWIWKSRI